MCLATEGPPVAVIRDPTHEATLDVALLAPASERRGVEKGRGARLGGGALGSRPMLNSHLFL